MYSMLQHEIPWTNEFYPQYQVYEDHLNSFIDGSWSISLHHTEVAMSSSGFFYSGYEDIVVRAFFGVFLNRWLPNDEPLSAHTKLNKNYKFISVFQDVDGQSVVKYHSFFIKITIKCYNIINILQSYFLHFKIYSIFILIRYSSTNFLMLNSMVFVSYL